MQRLSKLAQEFENNLGDMFTAVDEISHNDCEKMRTLMAECMLSLGSNKDAKGFLQAKDALLQCRCVEKIMHAKGYNIDKVRMFICSLEKISDRGLE